MKFEMRVKGTSVAVDPPPKGRDDGVWSIRLSEEAIGGSKVVGRAVIRDVPKEIAEELAKNLEGRRFTLKIELAEIHNPQVKIPFDEAQADRDAMRELGADVPDPPRRGKKSTPAPGVATMPAPLKPPRGFRPRGGH